MRTVPKTPLLLTCLMILALVACGAQTEAPAETVEAPPLADEQLAQDLPAGHPTIGDVPPPSDMGIIQPSPDTGTGSTGLTWQVPDSWIQEQPRSAMRKAQYRVPGEAGDAECVVFYFGPGQGGDAMANAMRWADQFSQPDGSSSRDALITEEIAVGSIPVLLSEVTGTYSGGMAMMGGPSESLENYMLLGAVAEGPDANWFFKLTGPQATVAAQKEAFRGMVDSLVGGG
jgi:hypothetical protein